MSDKNFQNSVVTLHQSLNEIDEVNFFLHCHLREYDHTGKGIYMDSTYYDKYGSPVLLKDAWTPGYYYVDEALTIHSEKMKNKEIGFPLVGGFGGGAHLYKIINGQPLQSVDPWNWTGWVPLQREWISPCGKQYMIKHSNRFFLTIRGNEIQNDLWDYDPFMAEKDSSDHWKYYPYVPIDTYRGGYWFSSPKPEDHWHPAWTRYLHIFAMKSRNGLKRYNYIVHPRAYGPALDSLPDASLDGIQWAIANTPFEQHFTCNDKKWGDCINGMEIFNDFTYFFSCQPHYGYVLPNGELHCNLSIVWYDTYPLEYCEFLLDTALSRGTYLQVIAANDAFYQRAIVPPGAKECMTPSAYEKIEEAQNTLLSDPKGEIALQILSEAEKLAISKDYISLLKSKKEKKKSEESHTNPDMKDAIQFLSSRPYGLDSVFGYTALINTNNTLHKKVFPDDDKLHPMDLDTCDDIMFHHLNSGRFYAHTGVYDIFKYKMSKEDTDQQEDTECEPSTIPYIIQNQHDNDELCYKIEKNMELKFTFCPVKDDKIIWRYSLEKIKDEKEQREIVTGYFKLHSTCFTILDLSDKYGIDQLKWIRFTAFNPENPMKRAWFSPITGPAFETVSTNDDLPKLTQKISTTTMEVAANNKVIYHEGTKFTPTMVSNNNHLKFDLPKVESIVEENQVYAYYAQGYTNQAKKNNCTKNSCKIPPPRFEQNIQGYFSLSSEFPSKLDMSNTWDSASISKVYFYGINKDAQPFKIDVTAKPPPPCESVSVVVENLTIDERVSLSLDEQ